MPGYFAPLMEGFILNASLIVCFGPQNTLILRQGLRRQYLLRMALICTLVDAMLIGMGTFGLGALLKGEVAVRVLTYSGIAALLVFGACSFKSAFGASTGLLARSMPTCTQVVVTLLSVSLLNPSAYIDTFLLIGSNANRYHGDLYLYFVVGAMVASLIWFFSLSYGSALLAPLLAKPTVLRGLDVLSGSILWLMAIRLIVHAF